MELQDNQSGETHTATFFAVLPNSVPTNSRAETSAESFAQGGNPILSRTPDWLIEAVKAITSEEVDLLHIDEPED